MIAEIQSHELLLKCKERSRGAKGMQTLMNAQNLETKVKFCPDLFLESAEAAPLSPMVL